MQGLRKLTVPVIIVILLAACGCKTLETSVSYERGNVKATASYNPFNGDTKLNIALR